MAMEKKRNRRRSGNKISRVHTYCRRM